MSNFKIDKLISNWGVTVLHGYFSSGGNVPNSQFVNNDGATWVVDPEFNKRLEYLSLKGKESLLWNTTVTDFFRYQDYINSLRIKWGTDSVVIKQNASQTNDDKHPARVIISMPSEWQAESRDVVERWATRIESQGGVVEKSPMKFSNKTIFVSLQKPDIFNRSWSIY